MVKTTTYHSQMPTENFMYVLQTIEEFIPSQNLTLIAATLYAYATIHANAYYSMSSDYQLRP